MLLDIIQGVILKNPLWGQFTYWIAYSPRVSAHPTVSGSVCSESP